MPLTDEERRKVAAEAVRKAEVEHILTTRTWKIEVDPGALHPENPTSREILFADADIAEFIPAEQKIAELMQQVEEWKRRAMDHGCKAEGDAECG